VLSFANAKASPRQRTVAGAIMIGLTVAMLVAFPFAHMRVGDAPAVTPIVASISICAYLLTAYLMFSQYVSSRFIPLAVLGGAYLFSGIVLVPELIAFPGIIKPHGLGGGLQATMWLRAIRSAAFPFLTLLYLAAEKRFPARSEPQDRPAVLLPIVLTVVAAATAIAVFVYLRSSAFPVLAFGTTQLAGFRTGVWEAVVTLGFASLGLVLILTRGQSVTQLWLMVALTASCFSAVMAVLAGTRLSVGWYLSLVDGLVMASAILMIFLGEIHSMYDRLTRMATIDGLTGVGNRRLFEDRFDSAYRHAVRHSMPLALIMIDVDFFKRYNDCYGHLAGDDCLRAVASGARLSLTRSLDTIVRYGGEEFAVILPETTARGAEVVAERIRHRVAWLELPHSGSPVAPIVTVSVGVTSLAPRSGETIAEVIARADAALYRAKALGRNRVMVVERPEIPEVAQLA